MEFKGTKGEWKVRILKTGFETEIACGEIRIAEVKHYNNGKEDDEENYFKYDPLPKEGLKNAKLIAAAPELLKELQKIKLDIDLGVIGVRKSSPIYEGIVRAINKALN
jgi:hypothetical protein